MRVRQSDPSAIQEALRLVADPNESQRQQCPDNALVTLKGEHEVIPRILEEVVVWQLYLGVTRKVARRHN